MINFDSVTNEKAIRKLIIGNLHKEYHAGTKPSIDFIYKILDDAYAGGVSYDVTDLRPSVLNFALNSTHQSDYCIKLVNNMKFKSETETLPVSVENDDPLVFYDVEVFPNLFVIVWKYKGKNNKCVRMINPTPAQIEPLLKMKLVGFNCRRYDNHIIYAAYIGYNNIQLYNLSQRIINNSPNAMFGEAYNISHTDVYDFASAGNKKSLKKFEIELGIHHHELGLPWDQPVPEDRWREVAEYCDDDVIATEVVFDELEADWTARQILADVADMTVNDTTNTLTTKIIFGNDKNPQVNFHYRNLAEPVKDLNSGVYEFLRLNNVIEIPFNNESLLPYFPGYTFENGVSMYRGEKVGEGGYVYAEPGMHINVALLDITSQHPTSIIAECFFGPKYTKRFKEVKDSRVAIKHGEFDEAKKLLDGKLSGYLDSGQYTPDDLSNALKTPINSAYGLTSAKFDNKFKDPRNVDNIVAKRGALFMIDLKHEVQKRGFTVAHIKTDSIKIPNATPEIIDFVMRFGKRYGYNFEHEATYEKMCLVNDAVYIAKYAWAEKSKLIGKWTATGAQFAQPYVFKTLFSNEPIEFKDLCETKSVSTALYLDMNESLKDVTIFDKVKEMRLSPDKKYTNTDINTLNAWSHLSDSELEDRLNEGHDYHFVGKVGAFCPIKQGRGGGILLREKDGKFSAATGSKGYRWLESEVVEHLNKIDDVDRGFFNKLVDEAIDSISKYGDFEWFIS